MLNSLDDMNRARELAETGQFAAVVDFLSERPRDKIKESPTLALLYGTAQARLGRDADATEWVELALVRSRERGDRAIEARALNVRGAMALVNGQIAQAASYFALTLDAAERDSDYAMVGKCSNNIGIINSLRGRYGQAIGSYTMALAAFQQAGLGRGIAEVHHNLAITYREQRDFERALEHASLAVEAATDTGDPGLSSMTRRGRAEIRIICGDVKSASRELEQVKATHRKLGDVVQEAEDDRVMAAILVAEGRTDDAEQMLRQVIESGGALHRPQLAADAMRDLAHLLRESGQESEAIDMARAARALFSQLGAAVEIDRLDEVLE